MAGKKRTDKQIRADDHQLSELYLLGRTQKEIAKEMGLSQPTVSRAIQRIEERWVKSSLVNFHEAKMLHLSQIRYVFDEAREAWEASKEEKTSTSKTTEGTPRKTKGGKSSIVASNTKATIKVEETNGDPRFLDTMLRCIKESGEILGYRRAGDEIDLTQNNFYINADRMAMVTEKARESLSDWEQGRFGDK